MNSILLKHLYQQRRVMFSSLFRHGQCSSYCTQHRTLYTTHSRVSSNNWTIGTQLNCAYSTQTAKKTLEEYHKQGLNSFVFSLSEEERDQLMVALNQMAQTKSGSSHHQKVDIKSPTGTQLRRVVLFSGVPFVGFGLLDNTIMLTAGEYIDFTFGAWLGITTMAAAALGNMVSDVLGITTAGFVEQSALKLGLRAPTLTLEQMSLRQTRWSANLGRCIGVVIGCLLGMWPLLVFNKDNDDTNANEQDSTT